MERTRNGTSYVRVFHLSPSEGFTLCRLVGSESASSKLRSLRPLQRLSSPRPHKGIGLITELGEVALRGRRRRAFLTKCMKKMAAARATVPPTKMTISITEPKERPVAAKEQPAG